MKIKYYDLENNLVNFSNSLLKKYQVPTFHPSLEVIDKALKNKKNVVVLLFDGMGQSLLQKHLSRGAFLRHRKVLTITSTFPPTTAAATNSLLTGKYPIETGWLGWAQYFPEEHRVLELFTGKDKITKAQVKEINFGKDLLNNPDIFELIKKYNPELYINSIWPDFGNGGVKNLDEFIDRIHQECLINQPKFIYGYFDQPDSLVHKYGTEHEIIKTSIRAINQKVETLAKKHAHTTFIVLADHSLINTIDIPLQYDRGIGRLLRYPQSNEGRATFFFVKEKKERKFVKLFNKLYGAHFILKSKKEVLAENWFGIGNPHPYVEKFMGDYLAVATDRYTFVNASEEVEERPIAHHAGLTEEETLIDVMIINS